MAQKSRSKLTFVGLDGCEYEINLRHAEFIHEYLRHNYNGKQSYLKVYPQCSDEKAHSCASRLLARPEVKKYLELKRDEYFNSLAIDGKRIIEELAKIGFVPIESEFVPPSVKTQALDKLAKIYGLYETQKEEKPQEIHIRIEE